MKKLFVAICCFTCCSVAVNAQNKGGNPAPPPTTSSTTQPGKPMDPDAGIFSFKDKDNTHDFGEVPEGPNAEYDFEFKNTGKKPITISNARGSCGCTVPTWPHEPILPKKSAVIHVTYHTDHRPGPISKEVTIESDAQTPSTVLHIRGSVKPKPAEPAPANPAANTPAAAPVKK